MNAENLFKKLTDNEAFNTSAWKKRTQEEKKEFANILSLNFQESMINKILLATKKSNNSIILDTEELYMWIKKPCDVRIREDISIQSMHSYSKYADQSFILFETKKPLNNECYEELLKNIPSYTYCTIPSDVEKISEISFLDNSINVNQEAQTFSNKLFFATNFETLTQNLGPTSFQKEITLKRKLVNKHKLTELEKNYLSLDLKNQAKKLFIEFALKQLTKENTPKENTKKVIENFKQENGEENITIWNDEKNIPKDIIILTNKKYCTIIHEQEHSTKELKGNELIITTTIGFDKEWIKETKAVKILKVI
jgi:hypothetical protein